MLNATQNRNIAQTEKRHLLIIKIIHKHCSQRQYISGAYLQTQINNLKVNGFGGLVFSLRLRGRERDGSPLLEIKTEIP